MTTDWTDFEGMDLVELRDGTMIPAVPLEILMETLQMFEEHAANGSLNAVAFVLALFDVYSLCLDHKYVSHGQQRQLLIDFGLVQVLQGGGIIVPDIVKQVCLNGLSFNPQKGSATQNPRKES